MPYYGCAHTSWAEEDDEDDELRTQHGDTKLPHCLDAAVEQL